MRILFLLVISSVLNVLNVQFSFAQVSIKSASLKSYNGADISCFGENDAEITVIASGGSGVYEYAVENVLPYQSSNVLKGLGRGTYVILVRDKNNVNAIAKKNGFNIGTSLIAVTINTFQSANWNAPGGVSCGKSDGILQIQAHGGVSPYTFSIDEGLSFTANVPINNLSAGTYTAIVKDLNGCTFTTPKAITISSLLNSSTKVDATCSANGSYTIEGRGSAYKVSLDNGQFISVSKGGKYTFSNLSVGKHTVIVTNDGNTCSETFNFEIRSNLSATLSGNATLCQAENASLNINISSSEKSPFTAVYKDQEGSNYTVNNLVVGENIISLGQLSSSKTFTLISIKTSGNCSGSVGGSATITVTPSGTWLGINSDWHDPKNWTCGKVPGSTTNVSIGNTDNNPQIFNKNAFANNLTILKDASLKTINTLQIFGNISNEGSFDATEGAIEFKGETIQTISGSTFKDKTIGNLIVSNSVGLVVSNVTGDTLNITGNLTFGTPTASLNTGNNITLKSTIKGTANIGYINPENRINGKFIVERYINTGTDKSLGQYGKAWIHLATPTIGSTILESWQEAGKATGKTPIANNLNGFGTLLTTGYNNVPANGFDLYTSAGPSIKTFIAANSNYDKGPVSTNDPVYNENGYMVMVRGDRTVYTSTAAAIPVVLRTKGEIITGTTKAIKIPANKWASVGNPYASKIYITNIQMNDVDEFISLWDPKLGGAYGLGAFQTLYKDGANYYAIPGGGSYGYGPVTFIESGQAFFVQTTNKEGRVNFTEDAKIPSVKPNFQRGGGIDSDVSSLRTNLYALGSGEAVLSDGAMLLTSDLFKNDIDGMDARKMANSAENFSIFSSGNNLALESRQPITSNDTIFFNMTGMRAQNYRLELVAKKLGLSGMEAWLEDNFLKTKTPVSLSDSTTIEFAVTNQVGAAAANRFMIIFKPAHILPVTFTDVKATKCNENVLVEWKVEAESNLKQYEVEKSLDGNVFSVAAILSADKTNGGNYQWLDKNPASGFNYYRIRSVDLDGKTSLTQTVKVKMELAIGNISVYPNPVANGIVNLQLESQPEGMYNLRLLNPVGQILLTKKMEHTGGNYTEKINWDNSLPRGMYTLEISNTQTGVKIIKVMY